jgi:hypothetical protein
MVCKPRVSNTNSEPSRGAEAPPLHRIRSGARLAGIRSTLVNTACRHWPAEFGRVVTGDPKCVDEVVSKVRGGSAAGEGLGWL